MPANHHFVMLPSDLHRELLAVAEALDITLTDVIIQALSRSAEEHRPLLTSSQPLQEIALSRCCVPSIWNEVDNSGLRDVSTMVRGGVMHQIGNLLTGECDMQLVGLKDTFFPVKYTFVLNQDSAASRSISVSAVQSIECVDVGGLPAGTYILTDLPNLVLSNFKGEWTFTTTA